MICSVICSELSNKSRTATRYFATSPLNIAIFYNCSHQNDNQSLLKSYIIPIFIWVEARIIDTVKVE